MEINKWIAEFIGKYEDNHEWEKVEARLAPFVKRSETHPLVFIHYAIALYEQFKYSIALRYSFIAFKKDPNDPFILYHHAIVLMCNGKFNDAIKTWNKILALKEEVLYYSKYGGGRRWGKSVVLDSLYYIARTYFYKNDLSASIKYYKVHLESRRRGIPSFKDKREVVKELNGVIFLREYEKKYPEKALPII